MSLVSIKTSMVFHLAESPAPGSGWRGWLAGKLRDMAARVDGDRSLRLRVETTPRLPRKVTARCVEAGSRHAQELIREACRAEAIEGAMRVHVPELYQDEETAQ